MKPVLEVNCFEIFLGGILGQECVWLSDTVLDDLLFLKNLTYEKQCKYAMKILQREFFKGSSKQRSLF